MSSTIAEKPASRKTSGALQSRRASREFIILGATSEIVAKDDFASYIVSESLETLDGLVLDSTDVREAYIGIYDGTVSWITQAKKDEQEKQEQQQQQEPGDPPVISFDTTGGTEHRSIAYDTTIWGGNSPDPHNLIGVQDDGTVAGVDVPAPALSWTEQHTFLKTDITWSYIKSLYEMTGAVNDGEFRLQPAGSVRFLGVTGQAKSETKFTLTFKFEARAEEEYIEISEDITIGYKKGFEYSWVRHQVEVDEAKKSTTRKPIGAYTQQVSPEADFADLGIGTEEIAL